MKSEQKREGVVGMDGMDARFLSIEEQIRETQLKLSAFDLFRLDDVVHIFF